MTRVHHWMMIETAALVAFVAVCTPSERQMADTAARDICAIVVADSDAGAALFEQISADMRRIEELERARLARHDAGTRDER